MVSRETAAKWAPALFINYAGGRHGVRVGVDGGGRFMASRRFPGPGGTIGGRGIEDRPEPMVSTKGRRSASHNADDPRRLPRWEPGLGEGWILLFPNGLRLHFGPEPREKEG